MKLFTCLLLSFLISCGQKNAKVKDQLPPADTVITKPDNTSVKPPTDSLPPVTGMENSINTLIKKKYGEQWIVVNDVTANWPKDVFDYFIKSKRKTEPDYPYIAKGDFNGDGKEDIAALINKTGSKEYQVAIILDYNSPAPAFHLWKEDIDLTAVSLYPKGELGGINGEKVKMKGDGVGIEYYETSSFVLYWTGSGFKRVWTGD